jgi:hypothetical protein
VDKVFMATGVRKVGFGDVNFKELFEDKYHFLGCIMAVFNLLKPPGYVMHHQV